MPTSTLDVLDQNTQAAFRKSAAAGVISAADADRLIQAAPPRSQPHPGRGRFVLKRLKTTKQRL